VIDFSGSQAARQVPDNSDIPNEVLQQRVPAHRRDVRSIHPTVDYFLHRALNGHSSKRKVLEITRAIAQGKGVKLDRMAKRSKECLICWFCEVAPDFVTQSAMEKTNVDDGHHIATFASESAEHLACPVLWVELDFDTPPSDHQLLGRSRE
jgi:hypothetical protein